MQIHELVNKCTPLFIVQQASTFYSQLATYKKIKFFGNLSMSISISNYVFLKS